MAHYTLIARINAGNGKFPFVNVQFSRNHRPIPIEEATYYLRPSNSGKRTPIRIGKDLALAHTALVRLEGGQSFELPAAVQPDPKATVPSNVPRKTIQDTAHEYIERSRQKSRRTYLGYRTAVNLFVASCKKTYFDEICRDDMLDFLHRLRIRPSLETGAPIGESTVFNYFLKVMVFLNDRGIGKYIAREDWVQKKDWPVNVDKRNKNKKYATYTDQDMAALLQTADPMEDTLTRFLVGTGSLSSKVSILAHSYRLTQLNATDPTVVKNRSLQRARHAVPTSPCSLACRIVSVCLSFVPRGFFESASIEFLSLSFDGLLA